MPTNDNDIDIDGARLPSSEAYGRAALLLVESLIHGLCDKLSLTAHEAVDIAQRAADVQWEMAQEAEGGKAVSLQSHALLEFIAGSLRTDDRSGFTPHLVP